MIRSLLWLTVFTAAGVAVLLGLGTWQVQRLHWKRGLILRIEARAHAEPISLEQTLRRWRETRDVEYLRLRFSGTFLHRKERHLYDVVGGKAGWRVITPMRTGEGLIVLVDRGFVPDRLKDPKSRAAGQVAGQVSVTGLARAPVRPGPFTPDNDAARNQWFWRDLDAMAAGVTDGDGEGRFAPFFVEAEKAGLPGGWPRGGVTRLELPNRHLEYAITWYSLAAVLVAVYCAFVWSRVKRGRFT